MGCGGTCQSSLILGQLLRDLAVAVVIYDLGAVANEQLGVDQAVDFVPYGLDAIVSPWPCL